MLGDCCGQHSSESDSLPVRVNNDSVDTGHRGAVRSGHGDYRAEANGLPAVFDLPTSGTIIQMSGQIMISLKLCPLASVASFDGEPPLSGLECFGSIITISSVEYTQSGCNQSRISEWQVTAINLSPDVRLTCLCNATQRL